MSKRQKTLNFQSDTIETVLARHKLAGQVRGGVITPRLIKFQLCAHVGIKVSKISALAEEIAMALGVSEARIYRQGSTISVEVPRNNPQPVRLLSLCRQLENVPPHTGLLGIEDSGTPLLLRLPAPDVSHLLIAGTTGSGKSAVARSFLVSMAMYNRQSEVQLILIDPKGRSFAPLEALPHVLGETATTPEGAEKRLRWLTREMERRDRTKANRPLLVVAVDELADLIQTGGKAVERLITRLAQRGREAGIHLIACTQKPTASQIGSGIVANFPVRLVGTVASKDEARYATGVADSGAEKLEGRGDFLLINKGHSVRFQAAWLGADDLRTVVQQFATGQRSTRQWQGLRGSHVSKVPRERNEVKPRSTSQVRAREQVPPRQLGLFERVVNAI